MEQVMQQTKKQLNIRNKKVAINSFLSRVASTCSSVDSDFLVVNKIKLTRGKYALVDKKDFNNLNKHKWCVSKAFKFYAMRKVKQDNGSWLTIKMHHAIMGKPKNGKVMDHINGDSLDNRRKNLRWVTIGQNAINRLKNKNNTTGFKGVTFIRRTGKWQARCQLNKVRVNLGFYFKKEQAVKAYEKFAKDNYKEFKQTTI